MKPRRTGYLRVCEALGIRALYVFTANAVQEPVLPDSKSAPSTSGWSQEQLAERRSGSRYFGWANVLRTFLHLPVIVFGVTEGFWVVTVVFSVLALGHILLGLVESYKTGIVQLIPVDPNKSSIDTFVPADFFHNWFRPKPWESEALYHLIGIKFFQYLTTLVISFTRLTREERKSGAKVEYLGKMTPTQVLRFEISTRVGEMVHGVMGVIDAVPLALAILYKSGWGWVLYLAWIWWGDIWLGFLQRFHRLRVWKFVLKCRERVERRELR